jgi:hypothetical protein
LTGINARLTGVNARRRMIAKIAGGSSARGGDLDDLIVGKDRVLFAIVQVGGFPGIGSHLIAVPYGSLPGATREQVKGLPEFKYR